MNMDTIQRTKGDLNFISLNEQNFNSAAYITNQSQKSSDEIEKTLSLSIQSNDFLNLNINDIIVLNDQVEERQSDNEYKIQYLFSERNHFTDINQIENQRLVLHKTKNSLVIQGFILQTSQMIVIKQINSDCQENFIKKLDEYKVHSKMNKLFPYSSLQLITPISLRKHQSIYKIEAMMERAEFNLYDYSRKYQISKQDAFSIFFQLIDQIINMHSLNIAHRDVKPQNIFLVKEKGWLLSDYGESQEYEIVDSTYSIRGTKYFLNNKLQLLINQNGQFSQNLLSNDLYALVITIIVIQTDQYVSNITEEIVNSNEVYLRDIISIKSLKELKLYRSKFQITDTFDQINLQDHCYRKLDQNELKENQIYRFMSWISLCKYYKFHSPNLIIFNQLLELIKKNIKQIYENFNYLLGQSLYSIKLNDNIDIELLNPLDILKNKKNLKLEVKEILIEILFQSGYTEQTIIYARNILQTEYSQLIHLKLIDSYYRAFMYKEAQIELQNFTQGLAFDQLNTSIQSQYLLHIDFFNRSNQQKKIQLDVQEVLQTYGGYVDTGIQSFFQDQKIHQGNGEEIIKSIIAVVKDNCKKFKMVNLILFIQIASQVSKQFEINMFLQYLKNASRLNIDIIDTNRRISILYETGHTLILLNKFREIKKVRKLLKNQIFKTESYQQRINQQMQFLVLQIFQQFPSLNNCQNLDNSLLKLKKLINLVEHITYSHYKQQITVNLVDSIKYLYLFYFNSTNVLINEIIEFSFKYAQQNQYNIEFQEMFQLYHIWAQNILLNNKNHRRCNQLMTNNRNLLNNEAKLQMNFFGNQTSFRIKPSVKTILQINTYQKSAIINILQGQFILNNYLYI